MEHSHSASDNVAFEDSEAQAEDRTPSGAETSGHEPHHPTQYKIRIDREQFMVDVPSLTGRELLELAGKHPPEQYQIFQKLHGGAVEEIKLDEKADFTRPGVERFVTLPLDQTEG